MFKSRIEYPDRATYNFGDIVKVELLNCVVNNVTLYY